MSQQNLPGREEEVLAFWERENIFQKTVDKEAPKGRFVFFEGPPTANGKPGIHHVESRAFKDCIPRFRTMQGYRVDRKGGWDTHGLPVELEVEKQLGFSGKKEIEAFGIAAFNKKCKESVWTYLEDWNAITKRIAFWVDLENAYKTYTPEYVESLWWIIKQVWDKGLLYKDYKVVPYCPRCGTSLSSHELAQGYKDVKDLSVTAEFVVKEGSHEALRSEMRTAILAWTTTPWTLPGNVGLAVGPELSYVVVEKEDEGGDGRVRFVAAKDLVDVVFEGSEYDVVAELTGAELVGTVYEPLYPFMEQLVTGENKDKLEQHAYRVYPADFVTTADGTGVVHTAVMYGQDDFELGTSVGLPKHHLVNLDGTFVTGTGFLEGRFVRDEDVAVDVIKDLAKRSLLFAKAKYEHSYPHCWRCKTALVYYAKDSWYIRMSDLRDQLLKENEKINWEPAHIKEGRFGEWLREVKDWAFSRERYWGTPLPIWECQECDNRMCIGSFEDLKAQALQDVPDDLDPHRPVVDEIDITCSDCGGAAKRVPDVCDVWFDSGCMPFAQWHYPFENKEKVDSGEAFPADYISEAIDQTRGWFYTLLAVSTLLGKEAAYKNVICLGHILDKDGKKMSKSLGNIVEPNEMINKYGADAVRWYMYTISQPGESKRFDEQILQEMVRKVFMILGNVKSFYELYRDKHVDEPLTEPHVLDRWILARLNRLVQTNTALLENYKVTEPARNIGEFITDLSTWYVRRSRDRFKSDANDAARAVHTLREVLLTTSKLMAPFAPFFSEAVHQDVGGAAVSVHLEQWPDADDRLIDETLLKDMETARQVVTLALEQRERAKIGVRQALGGMVVHGAELSDDLAAVIQDEVNVKQITFVKDGELMVELDTHLTPELIRDGIAREIIRRTNGMRKDAGLTIEDRIVLGVSSVSEEVKTSLDEFKDELLTGTLADDLRQETGESTKSFEVQGHAFEISIEKV